jgi:pilus assembly protein Flp/PilA
LRQTHAGDILAMAHMLTVVKSFAANESGATSIEYALIAAIVSIAIVSALSSVRTNLQSTLNKVSSELGAAAAN